MIYKNIDRRTAGLGILGLLAGCGGGSTEEVETPEKPVPVDPAVPVDPTEKVKIPRVARYTEVKKQQELIGANFSGSVHIQYDFFEVLKKMGNEGFEFFKINRSDYIYFDNIEMALFFRNEKFSKNKYEYVKSPSNNSKEDRIYQLNEYGASGYRSIGSYSQSNSNAQYGNDNDMFFVKDVSYQEIYEYQYKVIGDNSPSTVVKDIISYLGQMGADGYRLVSGENLELCCVKDGSSAKYSYIAMPRYRNGVDDIENIVMEMAKEKYQYEFKIDAGFGKFYNPQDSVIIFSKTSLQEEALEVGFFKILNKHTISDENLSYPNVSVQQDVEHKMDSMLNSMYPLVNNGYLPYRIYRGGTAGMHNWNTGDYMAYRNSKNISLDPDPFSRYSIYGDKKYTTPLPGSSR